MQTAEGRARRKPERILVATTASGFSPCSVSTPPSGPPSRQSAETFTGKEGRSPAALVNPKPSASSSVPLNPTASLRNANLPAPTGALKPANPKTLPAPGLAPAAKPEEVL